MEYKELISILFNNHISTWKKLKSYCTYFHEYKDDIDSKNEINQIYPEFNEYINMFPNLITSVNEIGDFSYNIIRLRKLICIINSVPEQYENMRVCIYEIIREHISNSNNDSDGRKGVNLKGNLFYNNSYKISRWFPKEIIFPGDVNLFSGSHVSFGKYNNIMIKNDLKLYYDRKY